MDPRMEGAANYRRQGFRRWAVLSLLFLLLSFNQLLAAEPQVLDKSELVLLSGERSFTFQVELADEPIEREIGLMHRDVMAPDHGMLFDFEQSRQVTMWMRNTHISLDMLFIDERGEIVNIGHDTVPYSTEVVASKGPVRFVLEVVAGTSRLLGIKPGDIVRHEAIGNLPGT